MTIPGHEGSIGPFPSEYNEPHVYARDVYSGAGNCMCGTDPRGRPHIPSPLAPPITQRALDWLREKTNSIWLCQDESEHDWFDRDPHQHADIQDYECRKCGVSK